MLQIRLLGQFDLRADGKRIILPSRAGQSLFAFLVLTAGTAHRREQLAGILWPDTSDENARHSLRQELWRIRKALPLPSSSASGYILADEFTISFHPDADYWLDVAQLERIVPSTDGLTERINQLSLYHGDLLPGFYDDWVVLERERVQSVFNSGMQALMELLIQDKRWTSVLEWGERWIAQGQTPEPAYRALMLAYAAAGERAQVVATYERCRKALEKELGVAPAEETQALYRELLRGEKIAKVDLNVKLVAPPSPRIADESPMPGVPPFKGLQYFDESDADIFWGREQLTALIVKHLAEFPPLLLIVGASGSGKSSIVRAGVLPALKKGETLADGTQPPAGSRDWEYHVITPTAHPLQALALSLTRGSESVSAAATLMDDLAKDPRSLQLFLQLQTAAGTPLTTDRGQQSAVCRHLLLVIDQFEELFTLCHDRFEREQFIDNLVYATSTAPSPWQGEDKGEVTLILALRADFYSYLTDYPELRAAAEESQVYIGPMNPDELRSAVEGPARRGNWDFEPGLVDLVLRDAGDEPGALPLLSHALLETWSRRSGRTMTLQGYADAGGVRGAIAHTAESTYAQLTPEQQIIARNIFLRLTELGEGTQDTRRRASIDELITRPEEKANVLAVLNRLADARLVTLAEGSAEVAHEALIREWDTLREWLTQDREGLRVHRHLTQSALDWELLERDPGALYRGARLASALEFAKANSSVMNEGERTFLQASEAQEQSELAEKEEQQQRELEAARKLAAEQEGRAAEQIRANRRLRRRAVFLAGALVLMFLLAGIALFFGNQARQSALSAESNADTAEHAKVEAENQRALAEKTKREASSRELAASAITNLDKDPQRSLLLALQAVSATNTVDKTVTSEAENALHRAVQAARIPLILDENATSLNAAAYSPDGKRLATSSRNEGTKIWEAATGKLLLTLPGEIASHHWNDPKRLATFEYLDLTHRVLTFWDPSSGQKLSSLSITANIVSNPNGNLSGDISPDLTRSAWAQENGTVKVWDISTPEQTSGTLNTDITSAKAVVTLQGHTGMVNYVVFSPDGTRIVTASQDKTAKVWDVATGKELLTLSGHTGELLAVDWSRDGTRLATASADSTAKIWDAKTGKALYTLSSAVNEVIDVAFSPDGTRLATDSCCTSFPADYHGSNVIVWDALTGRELFTLPFSHAPITFSPDGQHIYVSYLLPRVWDLSPNNEFLTLSLGTINRFAATLDGTRIATGHPDNTVKISLLSSGSNGDTSNISTLTLSGHTDLVTGIAFSPDDSRVATASADKTAKVWDAATGKELLTLARHSFGLEGVAYSADGKRIATASDDKTARVWDAVTGEELLTLSGHIDSVFAVAFSPDGTRIVTASADKTARVWDATTGAYLFNLTGHIGGLTDAHFSPDGKRLVTASKDGTARVWDVATGKSLFALYGHTSPVLRAVFSADGARIATVSHDGTAKVWDADTGRELLTLYGHTQPVNGVAFSPDGTRLITSSEDGTVRVFLLRIEDLIALAKTRLTRTWTPDECQKYLHMEKCPPAP